MFYSDSLKLLTLLAITLSSIAAPHKGHLIQFYPISQEQYDSILHMTSGKPVISEGRLISSGFRTLSDWRTSIASDLRTGLRDILNVTGFLPTNTKANKDKLEGYPLCVIKTNDMDYKEDDDGDDVDTTLNHGRAENDDNENHHPVVSCVVVVKDKNDDKEQNHKHQQPHASSTQNTQDQQNLRMRLVPYYYPPYTAPYGNYPYYDYPYYAQTRQNTVRKTARKSTRIPAWEAAWHAASMQRNNGKNIYADSFERQGPSTRSSYPGYPYYLGGYGSPQQGIPFGGCQGYNPYNYIEGNEDDNTSSEESSSEIAGDIGDEESEE